MTLRFTKGHGTENDFVVVADPDAGHEFSAAEVARICDRRAGIGADGVLRVVRTAKVAEVAEQAAEVEWFMDYRNADGSLAEMCGNGIRVFARYLVENGLAEPGEFAVATRAGLRVVRLAETGDVTVDMGLPLFPAPAGVKVEVSGSWRPAVNVNMGNPHAVTFVDDLSEAGDLYAAPRVGPDGAYPDGVNVEFVASVTEHHIAMRVHERGSGETRSCGTGACAAMIAAARRDGAAPGTDYTVDVPGGRLVIVERPDGHIEMTGPAVLVYEGRSH